MSASGGVLTFSCVAAVGGAGYAFIDHFVAVQYANCQPFKWSATADSILETLHRLCSRISGAGH